MDANDGITFGMLDVLVMPLVVHPVPMQDLSMSAIRTFPIFTYLNHQRSIRAFRFENKMQPPAILRASSRVSSIAERPTFPSTVL
jgi:hypothetical protein